MIRRLFSFMFCLAAAMVCQAGHVDTQQVYSTSMNRQTEVTIVVPDVGTGPFRVIPEILQ